MSDTSDICYHGGRYDAGMSMVKAIERKMARIKDPETLKVLQGLKENAEEIQQSARVNCPDC